MPKEPKYLRNNGSDIYYDSNHDHLNAVTPGPGDSHLHVAWDRNGDIRHSDFTFSNGSKVDVNPGIANSFGSFLTGK